MFLKTNNIYIYISENNLNIFGIYIFETEFQKQEIVVEIVVFFVFKLCFKE